VAIGGVATPVWPPTGISLAALLIGGPQLWPAITLGAFFANLSVGAPPLVCLGVSLGNTLEALLGYFLLRRIAKFSNSIERVRDVLALIFLAAILSTLASATVGTLSSWWLGGMVTSANIRTAWWTWWLGDLMGNLVVAPVILTWSSHLAKRRNIIKIIEAGFLLFLLLITNRVIFGNQLVLPYSLPYLLFPLVIWVAFRFGQRGTTLFTLLISGLAIRYTINGLGPFVGESLNKSLLSLQTFLGIVSVTSLFLAAIITQRKRAEEAFRESEERTRTIIEHALDGIIVIDSRGLITSWNSQAEKIFGWSSVEVMGRQMAEIIIPVKYREAHQRGVKHFLATGEGPFLDKRIELTALHHQGHEFPVELTISSAHVAGDFVFSAFVRDITEQKNTEEILLKQKQDLIRSNQELEHFAYASSHDLQEPLHTINGFVNRLKTLMEGRLEATELDYLERIHKAVLRMSRLIGDLLIYSRVTTKGRHFESVNMPKVIQDVLSDLEVRIVENGAKIEVGDLPVIQGDRIQIRQLFQNLIGNALKFHKPDQPPHAMIRGRDMKNGFVEITVEDEGIGFEEKFVDRIFEPFQRLHGWSEYEGSGIGLAICKKIVLRHGGHMEAKSELGKGSAFILTLPLRR